MVWKTRKGKEGTERRRELEKGEDTERREETEGTEKRKELERGRMRKAMTGGTGGDGRAAC